MLLSLKANLEIAIVIITRIIGRSIIFIVFLVMIIVITMVLTIMVIIIVMWLNLHKRAAVVAGFDWREPALLIFQPNLSGGGP